MRPVGGLSVDGSGAVSLSSGVLDLREAGVIRLDLRLDTGTGHDRCDMFVSHMSPIASTAPGTSTRVALAALGDPVDVLVVEILGVEHRPDGVVLSGLAPSHRLSSTWFSRSYVRQSVADVVRDVLAEADVAAGAIEAGLALEQFHVDGRRNSWETLHALARLVGAEITSDADGAVSFVPAPGSGSGGPGDALEGAAAAGAALLGLGGTGGLRRGADIISWNTGPRRAEPAATIGVAPLGAASSFGSTGAHHLLKQPESGSAQEFVAPAVRTADGATTATTARTAEAARRRLAGRFVTPGDPAHRPGDDIDVEGETWHLVGVRHRVDVDDGFVTELTCEGVS